MIIFRRPSQGYFLRKTLCERRGQKKPRKTCLAGRSSPVFFERILQVLFHSYGHFLFSALLKRTVIRSVVVVQCRYSYSPVAASFFGLKVPTLSIQHQPTPLFLEHK